MSTPAVARPFSEYTSRLVDLHELIRAGKDETEEGESLREGMDYWWHRMSAAEIEQAGQLSEDLYYIHESAADQTPFKKEIWRAIQLHISSKNWIAAVQSIRQNRVEVPTFVASFFEGLCWGELGEWRLAKAFFAEAYRRQPRVERIAACLLSVAARAGVSTDDVSIAKEIAAQSNDPSVLLNAAAVIESGSDRLPHPDFEQLKDAEVIARRGIKLAEQSQDNDLRRQVLYAHLGIALTNMLFGNRSGAHAACRQALTIDPNNIEALTVAGLLSEEGATLENSDLRSQLSQRVHEGSTAVLSTLNRPSANAMLVAG